MKHNQKITTQRARNNHLRGFIGNAFLVRGIGRRAIKITMLEHWKCENLNHRPILTNEQIAVKAAEYANTRGWKEAIVMPDDVNSDNLSIYNLSLFKLDLLRPNKNYFLLRLFKPLFRKHVIQTITHEAFRQVVDFS